jgi:hypothetical protein
MNRVAESWAVGFSSQYGIETYWKFGIARFIRVLPTLQLLHNKQNGLDTIIGVRAKISDDFTRHFRRQ